MSPWRDKQTNKERQSYLANGPWKAEMSNFTPTPPFPGFHTLNKKMHGEMYLWKQDHMEFFNEALQEIFQFSTFESEDRVKSLTEVYHKYKSKYVKHLFFNPNNENLCEQSFFFLPSQTFLMPAMEMNHAPLEAVHIYFNTATYDEIEKDEKVTC